MAFNFKRSTECINLEANQICALLNNGYLRLYNGAQPLDPNVALSGQTQLAELRFGATAFGGAVTGVATANALTADTSADATGTATWFRAFKADGTTALWDGTIGTTGSDLNLNAVAISAGAQVSVSSFTYTAQK